MQNYFQQIIIDFAKRHKGWVCANLGLMCLHVPIELVLLSYLSGKIFVAMTEISPNKCKKILKLTFAFLFAYFIIEICLIFRDTYDAYIIPQLECEIRNYVIKVVLTKNEIQFNHLEMGEFVARFLKTPAYSFHAYAVLTKFVFPFVIGVLLISFYVAYLNVKIGMLYIGLYTIYMNIFYIMCKAMLQKTYEKMAIEMKMFNNIEDTLSNIHSIYTSDMVEKEKEAMDLTQHEFIKIHVEQMKMNTKIKMVMSMFSLFSIISIFMYSIHLYQKKEIHKSTIVSIITLLLFLCRFLGYTARRITEGMMTIGSMMEGNDFINGLNQQTIIDGTESEFIHRGNITIDNISFRYNSKLPFVFKNMSIFIPEKSHIVLIGDSGSGKTTFLRLLLGFYSLDKGRILIDGVDINKSKRSYLRCRIAYINQSTKLFDRSIFENITYGTNTTKENVYEFIHKHNMQDIFTCLGKNWIDFRVGKGGENISGGMRQVVLLMRCHFRNCPIVILDEATSSIDVHHRKHAIKIIQNMFHDKTVICVSHDQQITDLFNLQLKFYAERSPTLVSKN